MHIDKNTALILEGGGLRGVFTCGVLDCFMDHDVHFPAIVGVSAGACNGLSYVSGQRGRAKSSNYVDGVPMLDGGIADSIPVQYALDQGTYNSYTSPLLCSGQPNGKRYQQTNRPI